MTKKIEKLSEEDLGVVVTARNAAVELAKEANTATEVANAATEKARFAELQYRVAVQDLYLAKKLDSECRVDIATGDVDWSAVGAPAGEAAIPVKATKPAKKTAKKTSKKTAKKTTKKTAKKTAKKA